VTRVYVPATLALLAAWHAAGVVPGEAERYVADGDDEESEYAALMAAADASAALQEADGHRRVVVVADVAEPDGAVPVQRVQAVHADPSARPADADPDNDLAWYATQEIGGLLGG
jgi:hypothetical protein